jgi:hypothetical protein
MANGRYWGRRALALGLTGVTLVGCAIGTGPGVQPPSTPQPVVAHLTADSPNIRVERAGQSVPYSPGMPLRRGDGVRTGSATYATIEFTDGNIVYVRNDSSVEVGSIRLFFGEIFNAIYRIAGGGSATYTNDLAAAAEATMFLVKADRMGRGTTVTVLDGVVRCIPLRGSPWSEMRLGRNQQMTATRRARSTPTVVDARQAAQWVEVAAPSLKRRSPLPPRSPGVTPPAVIQ